MDAITAAELQFSSCKAQLSCTTRHWCDRGNASDCSRVTLSSSRGASSAFGLRRRVETDCVVASSSGRWLPQVQCEGDIWSLRSFHRGRERAKRKEWGRAMALQVPWERLEPPKPTFIPLEQITGEAHFDQVLTEAAERSKPIVIDWLAAWCRKCIYLKPKLEKLAAEYHPDIKFYYVDVNNVPQVLVKRAEVTKMPTIQLWKDGQKLAQVIGGHQAWLVMDEVREMINKEK